ncbi:AraC family transcriptional regulator [Vibrio navarrensis]|uniref:AraC family transcriptional regulator n=1 Tax=Vibrio navarrensis TaxID=29495 RepID=UPI001559029F|nr:AraC family transcriptional regulator [Vibrio navarrensis]
MNTHFAITHYRGNKLQMLRNVAILSPSIIQVRTGSKRLYWQESTLELNQRHLLYCPASQKLTFENLPAHGQFASRQFSFSLLPEPAMLELSQTRATSDGPVRKTSPSILHSLDILASLNTQELTLATQAFWLLGLYQQLAEAGKLHLLFPLGAARFEQKLSEFIAAEPGKNHQIEDACHHFALSKATLIRRLKEEGTQYRQVLTNVRLGHALNLMQNGVRSSGELALMCGYQSTERFTQRFRQRFGLTPREYLKTLPS